MKRKMFILSTIIILLTTMLAAGSSKVTYAVGPYLPSADTYTDITNKTVNHGADGTLLLFASNLAGCVPSTYIWLKIPVPDTMDTISTAILAIPLLSSGAGDMDLELRTIADSDFGWDEGSLIWDGQPALTAIVLATASNPAPGTDAVFQGPALEEFLDAHKGQEVTLVVRANCSGTVSPVAGRAVSSKEASGVEGITLTLSGATAVSLTEMKATNIIDNSEFMGGIAIGLSFLWLADALLRKKRFSG